MEQGPNKNIDKFQAYRRIKILNVELHIFEFLSLILTVVLLLTLFIWARWYYVTGSYHVQMDRRAPYYKEVREVIDPLRYSFLPVVLRPDFRMALDFQSKTWCLYNMNRFDKNGKIMLENGRYGICGQLAAYTYDKIRPIFSSGYKIEFVRVSESGYFINYASHIILYITNPGEGPEGYILDPSFHRYGKRSDLAEYLFLERLPSLPFVEQKTADDTASIGVIMPIGIERDFLIGMSVDGQDAKFDENNYFLLITAIHRNTYIGQPIFAFRKNNGQKESFENKTLGKAIMGKADYQKFRGRIEQIFSTLP